MVTVKEPKDYRLTITAHCLVKNEYRFVWYSVMSVIDHVDKILLWDTGSTDGTLEIIEEIKRADKEKKVEFLEVGDVDITGFTAVRQRMLDQTDSDWFIITDGDEVWWESSIKAVVDTIRAGKNLETIISPYYSVTGDIYHYQRPTESKYQIDGIKGHITIRAINRQIAGLRFAKPHGQQGVVDGSGVLVQNRDKRLRKPLLNAPYLHFTNVPRSSNRIQDSKVPKRSQKLKFDLGVPFPADFYYPEVFFRKRPAIVPTPWAKRSSGFIMKSMALLPARHVKRVFSGRKVGY